MNQSRISIQEYYNLDLEQRCMRRYLTQMSTEDLKTVLANGSLTDKERTAVLEELNWRRRFYPESSTSEKTPSKSYPALFVISGIMKAIAWLIYLAGIIAFIGFSVVAAETYSYGGNIKVMTGFIALIASIIVGTGWLATAELIKLLIDISISNHSILEELQKK
ncbi:MAG: hypothetical protein GX122_05190 [Candidatus Cloacimonetes bacterium]|nr:hypothetical protein [Candidatus Cloacimonadota bacterium]